MSKQKSDYEQYLTAPIRKDRKPLHELLPVAHPLRLLIDPSDICNFRCEFCFQSKQNYAGIKMSMDTFCRIVEQLKEFAEPINVIHLYGLGEPLVNPNTPDFVRTIKITGVAREVAITTNGSLLTKEMADRLSKSGLDRLSISLNGICDEHFKNHVGIAVDFEKLYQQIQYFYRIRGKCHLHVKINGDYFKEEERDKFVRLFKDCTDSINIDHIVNVWPGLKVSDKKQRMYDYDLDNLNNQGNELPPVCPLMFYELLIHSDGRVSPCAVDFEYKEQNLGSIYDTTIVDIWNGDLLRKIRLNALEGSNSCYRACNHCEYTKCASTVNITPYRSALIEKYQ
ncbi:MAG: radical SAM protein [Lachnospiraceae bacterium]|nr:radical SAM protein [Lachnospiraceae bacterium]